MNRQTNQSAPVQWCIHRLDLNWWIQNPGLLHASVASAFWEPSSTRSSGLCHLFSAGLVTSKNLSRRPAPLTGMTGVSAASPTRSVSHPLMTFIPLHRSIRNRLWHAIRITRSSYLDKNWKPLTSGIIHNSWCIMCFNRCFSLVCAAASNRDTWTWSYVHFVLPGPYRRHELLLQQDPYPGVASETEHADSPHRHRQQNHVIGDQERRLLLWIFPLLRTSRHPPALSQDQKNRNQCLKGNHSTVGCQRPLFHPPPSFH